MLKTIVKVTGLQNLSDARYCAGMGVEMLGFPFPEVELPKFNEIKSWLAGVEIVAELSTKSTEEIIQLVKEYQPNKIQVGEKVDLIALQALGLPILQKIDISTSNLPSAFAINAPAVETFVLECSDMFDYEGLKSSIEIWSAQYPIILSFDLSENELIEWVDDASIKGIEIKSGVEDRPGFRDFSDLMSILEQLEID
jgi:phosphoribosylanthranilate isomerase